MRMDTFVFISYSSKNYSTAAELRRVLETNGFSCWMAPESIPAGSDYAAEIPVAIQNCSAFVLVLSKEAQLSTWVPKELDIALTCNRVVIPIHTDNADVVQAFNFRLTNVQRIEAHRRMSEAISELIARLNAVCGLKTSTFPSAKRWDTVCFGRYGGADIEWLVLEKAAGRMLLLSKRVLDICPDVPFLPAPGMPKSTSVSWEHSALRQWLNVTFMEAAFEPDDADKLLAVERKTEKYSCLWEDAQHKLDDNSFEITTEEVFVLSPGEVKQYFPWHKKKHLCAAAGAEFSKRVEWGMECAPWCLRGMEDYVRFYNPTPEDPYREAGTFYHVVDWRGRTFKTTGETLLEYRGVRPAIWVRCEE